MSGRATHAVSAHFSDYIFMTHGSNSPAGQENFSKQLLWVFRALCKICACFSADFYAQRGLSLVSVYCLFFLPPLTVSLYVSASHNSVDVRTGMGHACVFPEFICGNRISIEGIQWEVGTGKELDSSHGIFMPGISNCIKDVGGGVSFPPACDDVERRHYLWSPWSRISPFPEWGRRYSCCLWAFHSRASCYSCQRRLRWDSHK